MITLFLAAVLSQQSSYMDWMLENDTNLRAKGGLPAHTLNKELCRAAQWQASEMARRKLYDHSAAGGDSLIRATSCGYQGRYVTEIIAKNAKWPDGMLAFNNPWSGWCSSSPHYAAVMSRTADVGFGWATDSNGITYWCAVYGNKL
jgi:uncharacterized protein YkwD